MIPRSLPLRLGAWAGLALGAALAGACFDAPRPAVQFSCDAESPACPPDYACEADGCCHLVGSSYAEHEGECQLGGVVPTGTGPGSETGASSTGTSTGAGTSSSTASTLTGDSTESTSSSGSGDSDTTAGSSESGSSA